MIGSHQDKDLGNGVCPCAALGFLWPALEIGHTRFPALQHRKSNSGLTPDRRLRLKQTGFMPAQGKRFFPSFVAADLTPTSVNRGKLNPSRNPPIKLTHRLANL